MAVTTTGSTVYSLVPGLVNHLPSAPAGAGSVTGLSEILYVCGSPNTIVTAIIGSQIAYDRFNYELYMAKSVGGSTWIHLVSGT